MLRLDGLTRRFGAVTAVDGVSLEVAPGEILSLLGPSGCGKTTTLRMIAGFEHPTAGRVLLDGADVTALPPQRRGMGMVFQNYALFPHLDVGENVEFGLRARGMRGGEAKERAARALERVELGGYERRKVQALSGGQQQRVALARALAPEPRVVLLDEPLSNLDAALRERTRDELRALLKGLGITSVFVTHDQEEAFALADRIAVLRAGRLQQVDAPEALYAAPATAFVAGFLGRASFLPATVVSTEGDAVVSALGDGTRVHARPAPTLSPREGDAVRLMLRPESLRISQDGGDARGEALRGVVRDRRFAGATTFYRVDVAGRDVLAEGRPSDAAPGDAVRVSLAGAAPLAYGAEDEA
jgi:ABC-type Fe3+/spermidine/putrescine transport system ATPase subunit